MKQRHLGIAGERCPQCGEPIETYLDQNGKNPIRCCMRCYAEDIDHGDAVP